jgi:iron complex outermembrane receptor protein
MTSVAASGWAQVASEPERQNDDDGSPPAAVFSGQVEVEGPPVVEGTSVDQHATATTTVSAEQIDNLNAHDLASALRRVPGVVISRYNLIGAYGGADGGGVFIRGHGSSRPGGEVATVVDGVPRFVGVWAHPLLDTLSLDPVERIRVVRSPQPVLLGAGAFGSVELVSRRRSDPGVSARAVASTGRHSTDVGRLQASGRHGAMDWSLTASHRRSDGHRPSAGGQVEAASGRLGWRLSEAWDVRVSWHHTDAWAEDPGRIGAPSRPIVPVYDSSSDLAVVRLDHRHGGWHGRLIVSRDEGLADWLQWDGGAGESFRSITDWSNTGLRWRETVTPWQSGELIMGVDHDRWGGEFVERRPTADRLTTDLHLSSTAPYVMLSHTFDGPVELTPSVGVRWAAVDRLDDQWGAQAGLRARIGEHVVYANASRGFNLPGIWAAVSYSGWGLGEAWKELDAELVEHLEVGFEAQLTRGIRATVSVFTDDVSDAIRFVPPPPPPPSFANIGAYTARGAELSLHAQLSRRVALFVGATASDADPDDVPNLPETTAVAGLNWAADSLRLHVDAEWVDEQTVLNPRFAASQAQVGSYLLANARVAVPFERLGVPLGGELFVTGENLTDETYEYRVGYPMPGRTWSLGVDVRF